MSFSLKNDIFYSRRPTLQVKVGNIWIGSEHPVKIQSMTTSDPMDVEGSVKEAIRIIESGAELVRFSTPDINSVKQLATIKKKIRNAGFETPLVADIHYTPKAAELAAQIVEKVRINPGNYADKKKFAMPEYDELSYKNELERVRNRVLPLIKICKQNGTALRIGTNHGSLSDRIMNRYGDTALGMVESALEFVRFCEDEQFLNIILSMKASNPQVMVEANLLMIKKLDQENLKHYPIHLGVTEAGDGEEGRIKSALGIGTLLDKGIGDTLRISLTEPPENESPVAQKLLERYAKAEKISFAELNAPESSCRSEQHTIPPVVIADFSHTGADSTHLFEEIAFKAVKNKWIKTDLSPEFIYTGTQKWSVELPNGLKQIVDYEVWENSSSAFPLFTFQKYTETINKHPELNFVTIELGELKKIVNLKDDKVQYILNLHDGASLIKSVTAFNKIKNHAHQQPSIIFNKNYSCSDFEEVQLNSAIDLGGLFMDGLGSGIMISGQHPIRLINQLAFGILQAARARISKTEFISCPSCGRTQFNLQSVTAGIKKETSHLKGLKIAIMGCIVNGPGEMADADYGYVGSGKGRVSLYRKKEIVIKNISAQNAVEELKKLIKEDGKWQEPENTQTQSLTQD